MNKKSPKTPNALVIDTNNKSCDLGLIVEQGSRISINSNRTGNGLQITQSCLTPPNPGLRPKKK